MRSSGADPTPFAMRTVKRAVSPVLLRTLRVDVGGAANVPGTGGAVLAANHLSLLDPFLIAAASPRPPWFLGKQELAQGVVGAFTQRLGMVAVRRGSADRSVLEVLVGHLRAGALVAIFPEGSRSVSGQLYQFRGGMARLAAAAAVPVVPVALAGTGLVWPRGRRPVLRRPERGVLRVRFGEPLPAPDPEPAARRQLTERVQAAVQQMTGQPLAPAFNPVGD
jgi:1-acyl-sn-glycerol-3-phosphate acyltransferase